MRMLIGFGLVMLMIGCSDVTPSVSFLTQPQAPTAQRADFAQANLVSGSTTVSTSDGYQSKILIHSGSELGPIKTSDQYTLEIRSLSL